MDEELKKRSTDCVYFLASPLTCKKGIECEYRHSETARLNPRDCWYWLAGICFNPSCAFRHPPLDVHTEVLSESAPPQYQLSAPVNKSNTPCYFYFNGFCNKGVRCPFLHGPCEDGTPGWKSSKSASAVNGAPPLENKTSAVSDVISTPIETLPNPSEAASKRAAELQINPKPDVHVSAHTNVKDTSVSPHMSESECEEAATVRSQTLPPGIDLIESRSIVSTEQSSEEDDVDCLLEREDCLESSPGFDVLVDDDRLQNLGYEEDLEHLLSVDRDEGGRNDNFSTYHYEDPVEDDPLYPDTRLFYEKGRDDCPDQFNHRGRYDFIREFHGRTRERMLEPILPRKRKSFPANLGSDDQGRGDLRNHLKKRRRVIDGRRVTRFSKRNDKSFLVHGIRERPRKLGAPWLSRRLNSEVHCERVGSFSKYGNGLRPSRPRQRYVERRQPRQKFLLSEVSGKPVSRNRRSTEEKSNVFTGPKTLAQIREEKSKTTENGNSSGRPWNSSRTTTEEFQGPKPLSAILKERKKLGSVIDASNYNS